MCVSPKLSLQYKIQLLVSGKIAMCNICRHLFLKVSPLSGLWGSGSLRWAIQHVFLLCLHFSSVDFSFSILHYIGNLHTLLCVGFFPKSVNPCAILQYHNKNHNKFMKARSGRKYNKLKITITFSGFLNVN